MNRTLIAFFPPTALAAGLFLAHCSSSTPVVVSGDSGADQHSGSTGTGSGTGTGKGTGSGSGTGTSAGSSTGSGTGTSAGSSTGSGTGVTATDAGTGDTDAECHPPDGGAFCTPGRVTCGHIDGGCAVPATSCCETGDAAVCGPAVNCNTDAGIRIDCQEKGDCTDGKICCLNATSSTPTAITSCQTGPTCPMGSDLGYGQVCRSNGECANNSCLIYSCAVGATPSIIQACKGTVMGLISGACTAL